MERSVRLENWLRNLRPQLDKFKYPALVLLIGLLLLLIPGRRAEKKTDDPEPAAAEAVNTETDYRRQTEQELTAILSKVDGAGRVAVMLTLRSGPSVSYQTDFDNSSQTGDGVSTTARSSTVILRRDGAYDEAAVVKTDYPVFCGALVVSEGADDPKVRLALMNAVSALLGLGTDKITVVKMK